MSIERMDAIAPLDRREQEVAIIKYILEFEQRYETSLYYSQFSIGGTTLDGGHNVVDPEVADTELDLVNARILGLGGINAVLEQPDSRPIPIRLERWHGRDRENPSHHAWFGYLFNKMPQMVTLDLNGLYQDLSQPLQP